MVRIEKVEVTTDGTGLVSHAGSVLLAGLADRIGLTAALSAGLAGMRERRSAHDPGRVVRDLAVALADGGDCLADLCALRDQQTLFGRVASDATAFRLLDGIASDPALLDGMRAARALARTRVWDSGAKPEQLVLDIDATLIGSHSEKQGATGNWKGGFGFHPLLCDLDETQEALAGELRPGNAGANTAADQIAVLDEALAQLPTVMVGDPGVEIVVRGDSASATHELIDFCRDGQLRFSVGYELTETVRQAILQTPEEHWHCAITQAGEERDGAWVLELTDRVDLSGWPAGTRLICRRERPHPGAQLSFTDHDGHRFQCVLTDQTGIDIAALEAFHRSRANVEDRIRNAKDTGLRNLPFREFALNQVWLELVLIAQDLIAWAQALLLDGDLAKAEPKRLRYRLLHLAARLVHTGRRTILRLPDTWPWASALLRAFARLRALPTPTV